MEIEQRVESTQSSAMGPRQLMIIAGVVLVAGVALGGSFGIGVQVGRGQAPAEDVPPPLAITADQPLSEEVATTETIQLGPGGGDLPPAVIERMRAEGATDEDIAAIREQFEQFQDGQFQGEFPEGLRGTRARPGFGSAVGDDAAGGTRMTGTLDSIDENTITIMTPAGPQQITTISGTRITVTQAGGVGDLNVGDTVNVVVVPGPEGSLEASSITAVSLEE